MTVTLNLPDKFAMILASLPAERVAAAHQAALDAFTEILGEPEITLLSQDDFDHLPEEVQKGIEAGRADSDAGRVVPASVAFGRLREIVGW